MVSNWFGLAGLLLMGWCSLLVRESVTTMSSYFRRTLRSSLFPFPFLRGVVTCAMLDKSFSSRGHPPSSYSYSYSSCLLLVLLNSSPVLQDCRSTVSYTLYCSVSVSHPRQGRVVQWYNGTIAHGRGGEVQSGRT